MLRGIGEKHLIAFAVIAVFALLFWSSYALQNYIFGAIGVLEKYINHYPLIGLLIFIGLAALSAVISPFTSAPLIPAAIIIFGKLITFLSLWFGWILGGFFSYLLGLYAARPMAIRLLSDEKIEEYQKKLSRKTNFPLILFFRMSVPAEIPGPVLGALKYSPIKFLLATAIAELPYAVATIYAGNALIAGQKFTFLLLIALIFIAMSATYLFFQKKMMFR